MSSRLDRKSTRLNSSHVKISYAVFCLKKKKITRAEIKVVALTLDESDLSYLNLRTAWREIRSEYIAAVIIVFIRTQSLFFFFNDTATTEIYTLSLHDALPI